MVKHSGGSFGLIRRLVHRSKACRPLHRYSVMAASRQQNRHRRWRVSAMPVLFVAVASSAAIVLFATIQTSSARFAATTSNEGNLFTSALIEVDVESETERQAQLFLEGTGLYPGRSLQNCLRIVDNSSIENVNIRLFAPLYEGELGRFFEITITEAETVDGSCVPDEDGSVVFAGTLADFASQHDSFASGLPLTARSNGNGVTDVALMVTGGLLDDNDAQGLTLAYDVLLEIRPA